MSEPTYLATALAVAVAITVLLRALPFATKRALGGSALLADLGRWMRLGAVAILAVYCLSSLDLTAADRAAGPLAGTAATVAVHVWRHNAALSIVAGTATCVIVTNWL